MIIRRSDFADFKVVVNPDTTEQSEEVCVDLHVGDSFMDAGSSSSYPFDKPYTLEPGACIVVRTEEIISLPKNIFGTLCAKGSLAALGFLVPNTKVDPLFSDGLDIALFNAGKRSLVVEKGMPFCSLIFHVLQGPILRTVPRTGIRVKELNQQPKSPRLAALSKHVDKWKGVYALAAAVLAFCTAALSVTYAVLKMKGILP